MSSADQKKSVAQKIWERCGDDVPVVMRPSPHQYMTWAPFVKLEDGCDPDGYFLGVCPFSKGQKHPARFNFLKGVLRCDDGCFEKPTLSLTNAMMKMAQR